VELCHLQHIQLNHAKEHILCIKIDQYLKISAEIALAWPLARNGQLRFLLLLFMGNAATLLFLLVLKALGN
jgi:hypothetical protein